MADRRPPRVSVIVPAHNAAATLGRALDSLAQQTFGDWEAIVADDRSSDATADIARDVASRDARVRVVASAGAGASAARNTALASALGEWLLFLDADDWIAPDMLEASLAALDASGEGDLIAWGWQRVDTEGTMLQRDPPRFGQDPFEACAGGCPIAIHAALTRTSLVREVGGFDETLDTCEDWDLWLRLTRRGIRIIERTETKAFYLTRPNTLSTRAALLRRDGARVIERAHSADARVTHPLPQRAQGRPAHEMPMRLHLWCAWAAGQALCAGMSPGEVLSIVGSLPPALPEAGRFADFLEWSFVSGLAIPVSRLAERWETYFASLQAILAAWPSVTSPGFDTRVLRALESRIAHTAPAADLDLHLTARRHIALDRPLAPLTVPRGIGVVVLDLTYDGTALGKIVVPAIDGVVSSETITEVAAWQHWWEILRRYLEKTVYPSLRQERKGDGEIQVKRGSCTLATSPHALLGASLHDQVGWTVLLQEIWERPTAALGDFYRRDALLGYPPHERQAVITDEMGTELGRQAVRDGLIGVPLDDRRPLGARLAPQHERWRAESTRPVRVTPITGRRVTPAAARSVGQLEHYGRHHFEACFAKGRDPWLYDSPYEVRKYAQTLELALSHAPRRALELACAEGHFTERLAGHLEELVATDISALALERAAERCHHFPHATFRRADLFDPELVRAFDGRYDLVTCCEVLYYAASRAAVRALGEHIVALLAPGGRLVTAHANLLVDDPHLPGFDWSMHFGARVIVDELSQVRGLTLVQELRTPYYRISVFERAGTSSGRPVAPVEIIDAVAMPPVDEVARHFFPRGVPRSATPSASPAAVATVNEPPPMTSRLPILMYHSVAADGPAATARWRITPTRFAEQMHYLRDAGYRTVSLGEWGRALRRRQPIPGRCVAVTFDDAYADFATEAWPVMRGLGQVATVFVVTGLVGRASEWDRAIAEPVPLLDAATIRQLHREGVEFGSHTVSHPFMTGIDGASAARELRESRGALQALLGSEIDTLAYPYGDGDWATMALAATAGYRLAVTCKGGAASLTAPPFDLPRIEVAGDLSFAQFVAALDG